MGESYAYCKYLLDLKVCNSILVQRVLSQGCVNGGVEGFKSL